MTEDEGLSVREAVEWCRSGVTVREVSRLRQLAHDPAGRQRQISARCIDRLGHSLSHQSGNPVGVAAAAIASSPTV